MRKRIRSFCRENSAYNGRINSRFHLICSIEAEGGKEMLMLEEIKIFGVKISSKCNRKNFILDLILMRCVEMMKKLNVVESAKKTASKANVN